ncbi:Vps62-related protein [Polyangium jinanense]|uniref:Vps62-related protein n=1 Tax=Polyangium jinanense TaxID=2829994 RepID=A0A9X4ANV2_9BACT|nr:Vps62-related protein [Polyangium jinanense]MDC3953566.1 Vps62-related protein [Polyangium jinanense]MDC3979313.1 Vps62-related protein [Polyangium jinanense]
MVVLFCGAFVSSCVARSSEDADPTEEADNVEVASLALFPTARVRSVTEALAEPRAADLLEQDAASDLEIKFTNRFELTWNDRSSGGRYNGAYYRPLPPDGFYALGHYGRKNYNMPTDTDLVLVVKDTSRDPSRPALRPPVDLKPVWNDRGSGASMDGSFWRPVPPQGYVAMGLVSTRGHGKPRVDEIRCVRADLAAPGLPGDLIWNNRETGTRHEFGSWTIKAQSGAPSGEAWIQPGTFYGVASRSQPEHDELLWALRVPIPTLAKYQSPDVFPRLHSFARPSPHEEVIAVYEAQVPFVLVHDAQYTDAQRFVLSPLYTLRRSDRYVLINWAYNQGTRDQAVSFTHSASEEKWDADAWSAKVGISATMGGEAAWEAISPIKLSASATMGMDFTYTKTITLRTGKVDTWTIPLSVPAGKAIAAWYLQSTYRLFRQDGTEVGTGLGVTVPDSVVFDEFPR